MCMLVASRTLTSSSSGIHPISVCECAAQFVDSAEGKFRVDSEPWAKAEQRWLAKERRVKQTAVCTEA